MQSLLDKGNARLLKSLTRSGNRVEEEGMTHIADMNPDTPTPLQGDSCIYRIAPGSRGGQKVQSLRTLAGRDENGCADASPALRSPTNGSSAKDRGMSCCS